MNTRDKSPDPGGTHRKTSRAGLGAPDREDVSISEAYRKAFDAYMAYLKAYVDASKLGSRLTVKKAADILGVNRKTLKRWSDIGLIEHRRGRRGRERIYLPKNILRFMEKTVFPIIDEDSGALTKQTVEAYGRVIEAYKYYLATYVDASRLGPKLTLRKAAKILGVHSNTLRRWSKEGRVTSYRFGIRGDRRFSLEDIWTLAQERSQIPADGPDITAGRMLGVREVAHILHVHETTVRNWADRGSLRCHRVGHRHDRRFIPADVKAFAEEMGYPEKDLEYLQYYIDGDQQMTTP